MTKRRAGFTLIELLIVIIVVGVLATIAYARFWSVKDRGNVTTVKHDVRSLATHQETYYERNHRYANASTQLEHFFASPGVEITITYADRDGWAVQAIHTGSPDFTCGFYYGAAPPGDGAPATQSGTIRCDKN